jgi:hypothetical protein
MREVSGFMGIFIPSNAVVVLEGYEKPGYFGLSSTLKAMSVKSPPPPLVQQRLHRRELRCRPCRPSRTPQKIAVPDPLRQTQNPELENRCQPYITGPGLEADLVMARPGTGWSRRGGAGDESGQRFVIYGHAVYRKTAGTVAESAARVGLVSGSPGLSYEPSVKDEKNAYI